MEFYLKIILINVVITYLFWQEENPAKKLYCMLGSSWVSDHQFQISVAL